MDKISKTFLLILSYKLLKSIFLFIKQWIEGIKFNFKLRQKPIKEVFLFKVYFLTSGTI